MKLLPKDDYERMLAGHYGLNNRQRKRQFAAESKGYDWSKDPHGKKRVKVQTGLSTRYQKRVEMLAEQLQLTDSGTELLKQAGLKRLARYYRALFAEHHTQRAGT